MPPLPSIRLTGATILREGELRQRSVAISRGRITKGPLPAVDLTGYLVLPGIVDMYFKPPTEPETSARIARAGARAAAAGITTAWVAPLWSWDNSHDDPSQAEALLTALPRTPAAADLRPALRIETFRTDCTDRLIALTQAHLPQVTYLGSDLDRLLELQKRDPDALETEAAGVGMSARGLARTIAQADARRRELPRHLCRLAETFDDLGLQYGSLADTGGERREAYSMIGARIAACPQTHSAGAVACAIGEPVLLSAAQAPRSRNFLRAGIGDVLVSAGAPEALVPLALSLAGPDLAGLPRIWAMLSEEPAEIMRLADRGTLDYGRRADMVIIRRDTGQIEATICAGQLTYLAGEARTRFRAMMTNGIAAE